MVNSRGMAATHYCLLDALKTLLRRRQSALVLLPDRHGHRRQLHVHLGELYQSFSAVLILPPRAGQCQRQIH